MTGAVARELVTMNHARHIGHTHHSDHFDHKI